MTAGEQGEYDAHYTGIIEWSIGEGTDLATSSLGVSVCECFNDWPLGLPDAYLRLSNGWVVDSINYPLITVAEGNRHNGVFGAGFFIQADISLNYSDVFTVTEYVEFIGKGTAVASYLINDYVAREYRDCIFREWQQHRIKTGHKFINCILYDFMYVLQGAAIWINCLIYKKITASGSNIVVRDAECYNCIVWLEDNTGSYTMFYNCTGNKNIARDGTGPQMLPVLGDFGWSDSAAGDFSITPASILFNAGDSSAVTELKDITGNSRIQDGIVDIGPFEALVPSTKTFTLTGIPATSEIRIYVKDDTPGVIGTVELQGVESWTGGDYTYTYEYSADVDIAVQIMNSDYVESLTYYTLSDNNQSIPITLEVEENL
jgi:hypothetical protein